MLIFQKHVTIETRWHNIPRTIQSHEIDNARSNYTTVYYTDTYSNIMWIQTHWKRGDLEEHWQNSVITYSTAPLWEKAKTGKKKKPEAETGILMSKYQISFPDQMELTNRIS